MRIPAKASTSQNAARMTTGSHPGANASASGLAQTDRARAPAQKSIRIAVVEDDDWVRESLARQLNEAPGLRCVSQHRSGEEALSSLVDSRPEVVLMDINLPGMSGIECVRRLKELLPDTDILMLTVYEEGQKIFESLKAGASGYLLKRTPTPELLEAISDVHAGGSPMTGMIARKVVQFFKKTPQATQNLETLSRREREILQALGEGAAYKEIADSLSLSIHTIRMHIRGIYRKLHVHSRGEAVAKYLRH